MEIPKPKKKTRPLSNDNHANFYNTCSQTPIGPSTPMPHRPKQIPNYISQHSKTRAQEKRKKFDTSLKCCINSLDLLLPLQS